MTRIFGNSGGLKADQIRRLENLHRRRVPTQNLVTTELTRDLCRISYDIRRQIGILINRKGGIVCVIVGNHHGIVIPDIPEYRTLPGRLKGLRCIHTHLNGERLSEDDLTDLTLLRLDLMVAITVGGNGQPGPVYASHILPQIKARSPYRILPPIDAWDLNIDCLDLILALEDEIHRKGGPYDSAKGKERALLVSVTTAPRASALHSLSELKELARSAGISVAGTVLQIRKKINSRFLMGIGKLQDISIETLRRTVSLIIFDQELNPSQIRSITDKIDLKVIDRTQLILDIFSQRAQSRAGKLQVELAQLKYLLPRLVTKNTAMSRLTGGIGGRGPGETKLEVNRRKARDRVRRLEKDILSIRKQRKIQKVRRQKKGVPVISIIGYTNAGKSTLLNTLTHSNVRAENRLFATLDPTSRRLKFPEDLEVIITDTVGFIHDLPKDLLTAFRATLEELENANLLLHVIDLSNPNFKRQIESVERILSKLTLSKIPCIRVLNKMDLVDPIIAKPLAEKLNGMPVSAINRSTLITLVEKMNSTIRSLSHGQKGKWS